jgi:site-specific recombinase XerD
MEGNLEPLTPEEAVELYLKQRKADLSEKTLTNHRYRLNSFLEWCSESEIDNLNQLSGRDLHRFRTWRAEEVNKVTLRGILATIRVFLEFCAEIDGVEPGLRERVRLPQVDPDEAAREIKIEQAHAASILDHLDQFRYASREHVIFSILWHTGIRLGSLRAFDVDDFERESPCLKLRHRPKTKTPLKNGKGAERAIAIGEHYAQVLTDYIEHHRHNVKDRYGREPLLTSKQGRLSETPIRVTAYK